MNKKTSSEKSESKAKKKKKVYACPECNEVYDSSKDIKKHCQISGHTLPPLQRDIVQMPTYVDVKNKVVFESVIYDGRSRFLRYDANQDKFDIVSSINSKQDVIYVPYNPKTPLYRPYRVELKQLANFDKWSVDVDLPKLQQSIFDEYDTFIDIDRKYKVLLTAFTMETYHQHKIASTGYLYFIGNPDSGKTRNGQLMSYLGYRPLFANSPTAASVYTYLGIHGAGSGTIIHDEAHEMNKRDDKVLLSVYRSGYEIGGRFPRVDMSSDKRTLDAFFTFCCKLFIGLYLPNDTAFKTRCIDIQQTVGEPKKDELNSSDIKRFDAIRLDLLVWRTKTYFDKLPDVTNILPAEIKNRAKEIWKSKIQIVQGLPIANELLSLAVEDVNKSQHDRALSIDAAMTQVLVDMLKTIPTSLPNNEIVFGDYWNELKKAVGAYPGENDYSRIQTELVGPISKTTTALKLHSIFGAIKDKRDNKRTFRVDITKIKQLAKANKVPWSGP